MAKEKAEELEEFQEPAGENSEQRDEPEAKRRRTDKQVGVQHYGILLTTYCILPWVMTSYAAACSVMSSNICLDFNSS